MVIKENGVYKGLIKKNEQGLNILSMVESPAIEVEYIKMNKDNEPIQIKCEVLNEEKRIVIAPAMIPDLVIPRVSKQGVKFSVYFERETIFESLFKLSSEQKDQNIDVNHNQELIKGATIIEKFITDENRVQSVKGFENMPFGTLFFTAIVTDEQLWSDIKAGKINGWSIDGQYSLEETDVELTEDEVNFLVKQKNY